MSRVGDEVEIICPYEGYLHTLDTKGTNKIPIPNTYTGSFSVAEVSDLKNGWFEVTVRSNEPDNPPRPEINNNLGIVKRGGYAKPIGICEVREIIVKYLIYKCDEENDTSQSR